MLSSEYRKTINFCWIWSVCLTWYLSSCLILDRNIRSTHIFIPSFLSLPTVQKIGVRGKFLLKKICLKINWAVSNWIVILDKGKDRFRMDFAPGLSKLQDYVIEKNPNEPDPFIIRRVGIPHWLGGYEALDGIFVHSIGKSGNTPAVSRTKCNLNRFCRVFLSQKFIETRDRP